jgi:hypothetical protein
MTHELQAVLDGLPEPTGDEVAEATHAAFRVAVLFTRGKPRRDRRTGRLYGTWQDSVTKACQGGPDTFVDEAAVDMLEPFGTCGADGKELWRCIRE